jgi:hypothetical protein
MMAWKAVILMSAFAAFLLLLAACGGGCGSEEDGITAGDISDEQLALMGLERSELGDEYADLEPAQSRLATREERALSVSEDEAKDLELFGELKTYEQRYSRDEALAGGTGPVSVGTTVFVFESAKGASGYLEDDVADLEREVGKEIGLSKIDTVERFALDAVGDESLGLRLIVLTLTETGWVSHYHTLAWFREGHILVLVSLVRLDNSDVRVEAEALSHKLDERIQAVLAGQVTPTPVATQ